MKGIEDLREFIGVLRDNQEILDIHAPVDPNLELAEIHRRVVASNGPALLFHNVKNSTFPVATNLFGTQKRVDLAFRNRPEDFVREMVKLLTSQFPPTFKSLWNQRKHLKSLLNIGIKKKRHGPITEHSISPVDLNQLPMITSWKKDGGPFLTLGLVYTEPPEGGAPNLGMYRVQRFDKEHTGLHWQIGKGGGFHYQQAEEKNQSLPVNIFLGGPPALILSAIAPLPENVPEILLTSILLNKKLQTVKLSNEPYPLVAKSEFTLVGHAPPHERRMEGPFGDHYGYYSLKHPFPYFKCQKIYHRKNAIYPATIVGKPRQEDFYIGNYLQELLSPLFPVVMPGVKDLWSYGETGFHSLGAAVIKERFYRESMHSAFRILGEGQLALTKFLLLTDQSCDLKNFKQTLQIILERFRPETDLFIFSNLSLDTLDYTGPELNKGSRGVMLGVGEKIRDLPHTFSGDLPRPLTAAEPFCPGCLVVEGPAFGGDMDIDTILQADAFTDWPLVILVDNLKKTLRSEASFLWTAFTRFEPAADIYAKDHSLVRHHISYKGALLIDARMKPSYPEELFCDDDTAKTVSTRWNEYFPSGVEMGDSDLAHL